jgi:patatin-related protein
MDEELRIAAVMNGGVSLAVWIGGVTLELGRVVAGESAYGEIQALTGTSARVDVICGTSAGGVNGAFLAMAMAHHRQNLGPTLSQLRALWVNKGSFGELLRNPFATDSRSLLDGDGYFLQSLSQAFGELRTTPITSSPQTVPIDLIMTTTLLRGLETEYADDFGSRVRDVSHRATFKFSRGPGLDRDAFADPEIARQLALAARSTASFPAAFEPSFCPVGDNDETDPLHPNMKGIASFPSSRFVIDGGILDNSPIDLALDRIYHQRATGPVRRVRAYVVPDPGTTARKRGDQADKPDKSDELPELLDVGVASLVQIPAVQSISTQLQQLRDHNGKIRDRRRGRVLLTKFTATPEIDRLAKTLFTTYRAQRIADAIDYILLEISNELVLKDGHGLGRRGRREWIRRTIANLAPDVPWIPSTLPPLPSGLAEQSIEGWRWGTRPVEHVAKLLLDLVIRIQMVSTLLSHLESFAEAWNAAYDFLAKTEQIRADDREYWRGQADHVLRFIGDGELRALDEPRAREWMAATIAGWGTAGRREAAQIVHDIAGALLGLQATVARLVAEAADSRDAFARDQADELWSLFGYFVRSTNDSASDVVMRLLAFEVVQDVLGGRGSTTEQELEFAEISARSRSNFGGPEEPAQKIAGIQLAHFGAFYKSSWRANDWMWGRVDSVHRLVRILLDPGRPRISSRKYAPGSRTASVAAEIRRIAIATADSTLGAELSQMLPPLAEMQMEFAYLDDDAALAPESLPLAVAALSRRLEGEILSVELARVAEAVADDCTAGFFSSDSAKCFLNHCLNVTKNGVVGAAHLREILSMCEIGKERLQQEVGTDRLSATATQLIAVAVSSIRTEAGTLAIASKLIAALRAPALLILRFCARCPISFTHRSSNRRCSCCGGPRDCCYPNPRRKGTLWPFTPRDRNCRNRSALLVGCRALARHRPEDCGRRLCARFCVGTRCATSRD